jgi:nitroimidazol reductase NimA-like FMN-containing flavoprotein (pyridoxamine 5'-phosphate oxidase superfamily)
MFQELTELQDASFARGNAAVQSSLTAERRMTDAELVAFLDSHRYAVVATTRPSGKPHAAMTSYLRAGTIFWLPTMTGTARWRNVAAQPWLSLVVTEGEGDQHAAVTVDGPAATVSLEAAPAELLGRLPDTSWVTCWLRLTPARLFSYAAPEAVR